MDVPRYLTREEEDADSYGSWKCAIEWMRRQHEAGVPIGRLWREAEERQRALDEHGRLGRKIT